MLIKVAKTHELATFTKAHSEDAGFDLTCVGVERDVNADTWDAGSYFLDLGIRTSFPVGWGAFLFTRSSFPKHGWTIANGVGLIDSGYRGVWKMRIIPWNKGRVEDPNTFIGTRVAQAFLVQIPFVDTYFVKEDELERSSRGNGGFGSTGFYEKPRYKGL